MNGRRHKAAHRFKGWLFIHACFVGLFRFGGKAFACAFPELARPNVKTASTQTEFPDAPNAFAFAEAAIKNIMSADVTLRPIALLSAGIVTALDEKSADIISAR